MAKLSVQVVTAEREVFAETDVDMVVAPGSEGVLGILPRHAPLLTVLQPGMVRVKKGAEEEALAVSGGFLQVSRDRVLILADTAERASEIDEARAVQARERAKEAVASFFRNGEHVKAEAARVSVRTHEARIQVVRRGPRRTSLG